MEIVERNNKYNFLKPDGTYLSNVWFDDVCCFKNDFASVKLNNKWNFIKPDGTYLSEIWFDWVEYFIDGFVRVKLKNDWYKLDKRGNICFTVIKFG